MTFITSNSGHFFYYIVKYFCVPIKKSEIVCAEIIKYKMLCILEI